MTTTKGTTSIGRNTIPDSLATSLGYPRLGANYVAADGVAGAPTSSSAGVNAGKLRLRVDNAGTPTIINYFLNIGTAKTHPDPDNLGVVAVWRALAAGDTLPGAGGALYSGTKSIGAAAPTNGSTAGNTGDLYYGTTPDKLYYCDNGSTDHWTEITSTYFDLETPNTGSPTAGTIGFGAGVYGYLSLLAWYNAATALQAVDGLYVNKGTIAAPSWVSVSVPYA